MKKVKNMSLKKEILKKCYGVLLLLVLIVPMSLILFTIESPVKKVDINTGQTDLISVDKPFPKSSAGGTFEANDFKLKTEWIESLGTVDDSDLPYGEISKSLIGDFNGDGSEDFIFTDGSTIWVVDINGSIIYRHNLVPGKVYTDMEIGNLSDSPGVDIAIVANDSIVILSYPGIDKTIFSGVFYSVEIADIDSNSAYDEIIATNYSTYLGAKESSTIFAYNATGGLLWTFSDKIHSTLPCIYNIETGHDLEGDGRKDDIAAFSANNNPFRNITIWAINETGDLIYSWNAGRFNGSSFADFAIGNFETISSPQEEICFTLANTPKTYMIEKPNNPNENATVGWVFSASQTYEILNTGQNLIENSGARDDLLFGYPSGDNYGLEIRNGSNGSDLNWSIPSSALINVDVPKISIGDLDNNNRDEVIIGDEDGYLRVYTFPGSFVWKIFLGSAISIVNNFNILGSAEKEIIVHPFGHLTVLQNDSSQLLDIGNSKVLKILLSNLDADPLKEVIIILKDNRIIAMDNDGSKLWEIVSPSPIVDYNGLSPLLTNRFALMDKNNDGIDDYLYVTTGQYNPITDYILDLSSVDTPTVKYRGNPLDIAGSSDVIVGDFDRDGKRDDFAVGGLGLKVFTDTLSGLQTIWTRNQLVGQIYNMITDMAVGDFNGDNYDDIACTFFSWNTSNPQVNPVNTTVMTFNGLTGGMIFRYDNLNGTRGLIEAGDLNADSTDEVVIAYSIFAPNGNITAVKRSGSTGTLLWNEQIVGGATKELKLGQFTNDSKLDVAVISWFTAELKVYNGSNGDLLTEYNSLYQTNIAGGKINNEDNDDEIITGSVSSGYSTVNILIQNYSLAFPYDLNNIIYPVYQDGDVTFVQAGNVTGGSKDNILVGTSKGTISCLISFEETELKSFDLKVSLQNKTVIAGEYIKIYFKIERDEPDALRKIEMSIYEWSTGKAIESYIMEDSLKDLRIEPGHTQIEANMLLPISLKGKYYITGKIFIDNITKYDILNDATEEPFVTPAFDVVGKTSYTFIESIDVNGVNIEYSDFLNINITIKNTQLIDDNLTLEIKVCSDNFILNSTSENVLISANNQTTLQRSIYVPFKIPSKLLSIFSIVYVSIKGYQGYDSKSVIMGLDDSNGFDSGYYFSSAKIFNSTALMAQFTLDNLTSKILQINRATSSNIENYTLEVALYNDYNFYMYLGGMYLVSDMREEATLFSNDTKEPGVQVSFEDAPYGLLFHPGKTELLFNLNFSFAQAKYDGVHAMYMIILAINPNTLNLERSTLKISYNLTGELSNTIYFTNEFTISNAIVQTGLNITATAILNFTSTPITGSNITAIIHLQDALNESHYYNITKVYDIGDLNTLTINMTISTEKFANSLVGLYLGVIDENYSKIIVPYNILGIYSAIIQIVDVEQNYLFLKNALTTKAFDLDYGNLSITINPKNDLQLYINSFTAYSNPATSYIASLISEGIDAVGFWKIESNITLTTSKLNQPITIKIYYVPESAFAQRIHEQNLIPYYFNETSKQWQNISTFTLLPNQNSISFTIPHLSDFAIGGIIDDTSPLVQITTTFIAGKTYNHQVTINWQSTFSDWSIYWTRYSLYLDNSYLNDTTNNSQTISLPTVEKLYTIKVIGFDVFNNSAMDVISVWLDLDTLSITSTSDDVKNNGDLPSTGYLKLSWQGSQDILYYTIRVNGETIESHYTGTSYEFIFTESDSYIITILGVDSYGDQTEVTFTVNYETPEEVSESSEEFNPSILALIIGATVIISAVGVVLLFLRKDKIVDYSKAKSIKK